MQQNLGVRAASRAVWWVVALLLAACGGGGGGGSDGGPGGSAGTTRLEIESAAELEIVERQSRAATFRIRIVDLVPTQAVYVAGSGGGSLVTDGSIGEMDGNGRIEVRLTLAQGLPAGTYRESVRIEACFDQACARPLPGSPAQVPVTLTVTPNIRIDPEIRLQRQGAEPAPVVEAQVVIPPGISDVALQQVSGVPNQLRTSLSGGTLRVETDQLRAGRYEARYALMSPSRPEYSAETTVIYEVLPPPGGEVALAVTPAVLDIGLFRGESGTRRLTVTPPSWTDAPIVLTRTNCPDDFTIVQVDRLNWDVSFASTGRSAGFYACWLGVAAGALGGSSEMLGGATVNDAFAVLGNFSLAVGRTTTADQLRSSAEVRMADGSAAIWTASVNVPWARLLRSSGATGVDLVEVEFDAAALPSLGEQPSGVVRVSVDRPGLDPKDIDFSLNLTAPRLIAATPGALVGTSGRIVVTTRVDLFDNLGSLLQVAGARVVRLLEVTDPILGDVRSVVIDVADAVPGQPVTITAPSTLLPSTVSVPVVSPPLHVAALQALPYGQRRPPRYSAANDALYFSGEGQVFRFAHGGGGWQLSSVARDGVIDVDPAANDTWITALDDRSLVALDPSSLQPLRTITQRPATPPDPGSVPDAGVPLRAMSQLTEDTRWVTTRALGFDMTALQTLDDRSIFGPDGQWSFGRYMLQAQVPLVPRLVTSAGRQAVLGQASGLATYRVDTRIVDSLGIAVSAGALALSDDGRRIVFDDGRLLIDGTTWVSLAGSLPSGLRAGGWTIAGDGSFALAYVYRLQGSGDTATATDAALLVLDLANAASAPGAAPPLRATLALAAPLGCGSPRAAGETCEHAPHLGVDPTGRLAFALGPRGVAAVPLPAPGSVSAARAQRDAWGAPGKRLPASR